MHPTRQYCLWHSHHGTQVCMLRDLYRSLDGGSLT